jgi:hypothetical protein
LWVVSGTHKLDLLTGHPIDDTRTATATALGEPMGEPSGETSAEVMA